MWVGLWSHAAIPFGHSAPCAPSWCWLSDRSGSHSFLISGWKSSSSFLFLKMDLAILSPFHYLIHFNIKFYFSQKIWEFDWFHGLQLSLGRINILPVLSDLMHEHSIHLNLVRSSLVSQESFVAFSVEILNNFCLIFSRYWCLWWYYMQNIFKCILYLFLKYIYKLIDFVW